jgi:hypothetical protein
LNAYTVPLPIIDVYDQVAGLVERKVRRIERIVAHGRKLARPGRPPIDALPVRVDEVVVAGGIDGAARDVVETARDALDLGTSLDDGRGRSGTLGDGFRTGDVEPRELALPDLDVMRPIVHRRVERHLAVAV